MNPVEDVAKRIESKKNDILVLYDQRLKEKIKLPQDVEKDYISAVIPREVDYLIQSLIKCSKSGTPVNKLAWEHNKLKALKHVFTLDILISQFMVLKDVIEEVLEEDCPINKESSNVIWQYIVTSIRVAVTEFERVSMNESDEMKQKLVDSDSVNQRISAQMVSSGENEERYKTLVQGVEDYAVFTIDKDGFITTWNLGAARMKGYESQEVIGKHFSMLYPKDGVLRDEPMHHLHVALIEGRYRGEGIRRRKNGERFLADVYIRPIFKDGKHLGFAKVVSDVTERNKLIQSANLSMAEIIDLKSEQKMMDSFIAKLSHDLRTPLMISRAASELAGRYIHEPEKAHMYIEKSVANIDRTARMINELLDARKLKAGGKLNLNINSWDMVRLVKNVCHDYEVLGAHIHFHCDQSELKGYWDGDGVRRIMENLIGNAMKYGDRNYPVDVNVIDLDDSVCLKVHNMGNVIRPEEKISIFDQFTRADSARKKGKGWGIGLSLVKGVTEAHGGTVEVESYPVDGTTFVINLPKSNQLDSGSASSF